MERKGKVVVSLPEERMPPVRGPMLVTIARAGEAGAKLTVRLEDGSETDMFADAPVAKNQVVYFDDTPIPDLPKPDRDVESDVGIGAGDGSKPRKR